MVRDLSVEVPMEPKIQPLEVPQILFF